MNAAVLLLYALVSALAVEVRGPDVQSSGNHLGRQSDDERSGHTNLAPRSGASAPAELLRRDMAKGPAGRGASKTVGLGLACWPLVSCADFASSATPIGAAAAPDASAAVRPRGRLLHDGSPCSSIAKVELSKSVALRLNASQHLPRQAESFANGAAPSTVVDERSAQSNAFEHCRCNEKYGQRAVRGCTRLGGKFNHAAIGPGTCAMLA